MCNARSVPGRTGRYRSALRVIGVIRGSATISLPPLSRQRHRYSVVIGAHSATFAPVTNTTWAFGMSDHGFGERSMPKAIL